MSWRTIILADHGSAIPCGDHELPQGIPNQEGGFTALLPGDHSEHCAYSAQEESQLLELLATITLSLSITPLEVKNALDPEEIEEWARGDIKDVELEAFARALIIGRERAAGIRPASYTHRAECLQCGPVWLWAVVEVLGCPWCKNRFNGLPIPRPTGVRCQACIHFDRINHPQLGHCRAKKREDIEGLWGATLRVCDHFTPHQSSDFGAQEGANSLMISDKRSRGTKSWVD